MKIAAQTKAPAIPWADADMSHIELGSSGGITVEAMAAAVASKSSAVELGEELFRAAVTFQTSDVPFADDMFP